MKKINLLALVSIPGLLFLSHHWVKAAEVKTIQAKLTVNSPTGKTKIYGTGIGPKPGASVPPPVLPRAGTSVSNKGSHIVAVIRRKGEEKKRQKQVRIRELDQQIAIRKQKEKLVIAQAQLKPTPQAPAPRVATPPQAPAPRVTRTPQAPAPRVARTPQAPAPRVTRTLQAPAPRVARTPQAPAPRVARTLQAPAPRVARTPHTLRAATSSKPQLTRFKTALPPKPSRSGTVPQPPSPRVATAPPLPSPKVATPSLPQPVPAIPLAPTPPAPSVEVKELAKKLKLEKVSFLCGKDESIPATIGKMEGQEEVPMILWSSDFFTEAGYDPQTRCQQVSARLETYKKNDELSYLTTGKINGQSVVCVTSQEEGNCGEGISVHDGLLFTLKPDENPQERLEQLFVALQGKEESQQKSFKE